jgi:Skp family chaperone for outer membrane proteins
MQKIIITSIATLFLAVSFNLSVLFAQQAAPLKIGIVDIEVILKEMPEAVDADKKLKEIGLKWQDSLLAMKKSFDDKVAQYQKQKSLKNADQQQKEEEMLQNLQTQLMQYQETKFGQTGELNATREKYLDPIRSKVRAAIQKVSKEEKISLVLDKTSTAILYFDDKFDLTYKVLDTIKRGNN